MGFLDKIKDIYDTALNQAPGGPSAPLWSTDTVVGQALAEALGSANTFRKDISPAGFFDPPKAVLSHMQFPMPNNPTYNPLLASMRAAKGFALLPTRVGSDPIGAITGNPLTRSLTVPAGLAGRATSALVDKAQGTPSTSTPSPTERTSAWDTSPEYAVMRNLTRDDYIKPFQNATSSQQITDRTTAIVLNYFAKEGIAISPEVADAFKQSADQMLHQWYNQQKVSQQRVDISEYYRFMSDALLAIQKDWDAIPPDQTSTTTQPQNVTEAAYATAQQQPSTQTQTEVTPGAGWTPAKNEAEAVPSEDMLAWNGSFWGDNQSDPLRRNQNVYNSYLAWIQTVAQPSWNKTPDAYIAYLNAKVEANKQRGGQ